jgi:hypothetical protein
LIAHKASGHLFAILQRPLPLRQRSSDRYR